MREHQPEEKGAGGAGLSIGCVERRPLLGDPELSPSGRRSRAGVLVVVELLGCLGGELDVWSKDDGVDSAPGLLCRSRVDAFRPPV